MNKLKSQYSVLNRHMWLQGVFSTGGGLHLDIAIQYIHCIIHVRIPHVQGYLHVLTCLRKFTKQFKCHEVLKLWLILQKNLVSISRVGLERNSREVGGITVFIFLAASAFCSFDSCRILPGAHKILLGIWYRLGLLGFCCAISRWDQGVQLSLHGIR